MEEEEEEVEEKGVMSSRGNKGEVVREGGAGKMVVSEAMSER